MKYFSRSKQPYYVIAPDYRANSAGITALYILCHALNELGFEAYVTHSVKTNELIRAPLLSRDILISHYLQGLTPISVLPETFNSDPFLLPTAARWLLNASGHLSGPTQIPEHEHLFHFDDWVLDDSSRIRSTKLRTPTFDTSIFNNTDSRNDEQRSLITYYANKYLAFGGYLDPNIAQYVSLGQEIRRTKIEIADILRKAQVLYCFEQSSIIPEALACGCPVLLVPSEYWPKSSIGELAYHPGIRLANDTDGLAQARATIGDYAKLLELDQKLCTESIKQFIGITQISSQCAFESRSENTLNPNLADPSDLLKALWLLPLERREHLLDHFMVATRHIFSSNTEPPLEGKVASGDLIDRSKLAPDEYWLWLNRRNSHVSDESPPPLSSLNPQKSPSFLIVLPLFNNDVNSLAITLDGLNSQKYADWHCEVLTTLPAPAEIDEIPYIGWHCVNENDEISPTINSLVAEGSQEWIVELPSGAILDPLYFWRITNEIQFQPDAFAFYVDDDCIDEFGLRSQTRFKPGVNPEFLRSSDRAGPICVRRDVWLSTKEARNGDDSPWFSKLLRIAGDFGWHSIRHIPDVLITYSGSFPCVPTSCLTSLIEDMQLKGSVGEIIPVSGQSWNIRYPLSVTPSISIAILSQGHVDLLSRCLDSIIEKTSYPNFEILISLSKDESDPDFDSWLIGTQKNQPCKIRTIRAPSPTSNLASRCNAAVTASLHEFVLLIREEAVIIQEKWLEELLRTCLQPDIAAVSPCLIRPGSSLIENVGRVLGLTGLIGSPYQGKAKLGELGYLDFLRVARDVSALSSACILVRKSAYLEAGGMDELELGDYLADADLCLKLRRNDLRLIIQPLATVVFEGVTQLDIEGSVDHKMRAMLAEAHATEAFSRRWLPNAAVDPFFNPNLSLVKKTLTPETDFQAQWQYQPSNLPRFLARPLPNAQGVFRITSPLGALRTQGRASECIWPMEENGRELSVPELLRLSADTLIVQHYLSDKQLAALQAWNAAPGRPFVVYALDDLVSNLAKSNPFFKDIPANSRTRLKYALERCDRLVSSTDYLAETYRHFCADIRVVANRLEQEIWLPLQSRKRTASKPRIGWAGGTTHQGDLVLLKEVIEQTRNEADWIFFGMCPSELRPLLAEYHPFTQFADYPARLAALNLDIGVAPLARVPFNQGKSNLRLLEYGILGIPVVCTDIDPYHNSPACRVANTPEAWIEALRERIYDADAREHEGAAMRKWVQQHFLLEDHLEEWLSAHLPSN